MGRIKTQFVKRVTKQLVNEHADEVSTDFTKNKEFVDQYLTVSSKKIRNVIAGYATRLAKARLKGQA